METIIVGLTLLLIYAVVKHMPAAIPDPAALAQSKAALALGSGAKLSNATERLVVGFFIHACFSGVVMLAVSRRDVRWLFVAMVWHFAHDMVGFNLHRLSGHWITSKAWIAIIVVSYSYLGIRICRALRETQSA